MKIKLTFSLLMLLISAFVVFAQQNEQKQPGIPTFKANLIVEDILFAANALSTVEITGNEVDPFLQAKGSILNVVKFIQSNNKRNGDTLTLDIQVPLAQNLLIYMNKAKFQGSQAENYKRFVDALIEGLKPGKPKQ